MATWYGEPIHGMEMDDMKEDLKIERDNVKMLKARNRNLIEERDSLIKERDRLKRELEEAKDHAYKIAKDMVSRIFKNHSENSSTDIKATLETQVEEMKVSHAMELNRMDKEIAGYRNKITNLNSQCSRYSVIINSLNNTIEIKHKDLIKFSKEKKQLLSEKCKLNKQIDEHAERVEHFKRKINHLEHRIQKVEHGNENQRRELAKKESAILKYIERITSYRNMTSMLQKERDALKGTVAKFMKERGYKIIK